MRRVRPLSLRTRLILTQLVTAAVVLFFCAGVLMVYGARSYEDSLRNRLVSMAQLVGRNSEAAVAFLDPDAAAATLASVEAESAAVNAWIRDHDGVLFATYARPGYEDFDYPRLGTEGRFRDEHGFVLVSRPIVRSGQTLGTVGLRYSKAGLNRQTVANLLLAGAVLLLGGVVAAVLGVAVQRSIAAPILELARSVREVSATGDLARRVRTDRDDEIGTLYDGFNTMLGQLQAREEERDAALAALERLNQELEERVRRRTAQLEQANDDLARERALLTSLIDSIPDLVFFKDTDGVYLGCNRAFEAHSGIPRHELVGSLDSDVYPAGEAETYAEWDRQVLAAGEAQSMEEWTEGQTGGRVLLHTLKTPIVGPEGTRLGTIGISRDITAHKLAEERLEEALEAAEAASRAKGEFLANMSHEIRTPMNAVLGLVHLLERSDLDPRQRDYVARIVQASTTLVKTIDDILDFSKIEAGRLEVEQVPFDPRPMLAELADLMRLRAGDKELELAVRVDPDVPVALLGDPLRVRQVLVNLTDNAVKFTAAGGVEVTLDLLGRDAERVTVRWAVRDTGIGLSVEQAERLFEPFTQADGSTSRRFGGTGLGLSICRRLVTLMGGELQVQSTPGQGSEFAFSLELGWSAEPVPPPGIAGTASGSEGARLAGARVLLVEDNEINQMVAEELLASEGAEVTVCSSGEAALEELAAASFDLVLMDIQMPGMDGIETTRRLRSDPRCAALPVIALTANTMPADRERYLAAGLDDHVPKPIEAGELYDVLGSWLGRGSATAASDRRPLALDRAVGLARVRGREEVYRKILSKFRARADEAARSIRAAVTAGRFDEATGLAHSLKGAAGNVAAVEVYEVAAALETALRRGASPDETRPVVDALDEALTRAERAVDELLSDG